MLHQETMYFTENTFNLMLAAISRAFEGRQNFAGRIVRFTFSAGQPRNDYGQTVWITYDDCKTNNGTWEWAAFRLSMQEAFEKWIEENVAKPVQGVPVIKHVTAIDTVIEDVPRHVVISDAEIDTVTLNTGRTILAAANVAW